ncbi:MAG: tRNA lysidine(34) synthetase TilS [Chloroflexi bacterium]|nr:tRNA lysidine(34) synthetase TilS [Chloroflexota bacterium]
MLDQVRATIAEHSMFAHGDTVVVAVSGGPDSLALLHALRALRDELRITLHVAHLNHQLRGAESDADAEFVANLAREWKLPATVEARDVAAFAREKRLSLEEAARHTRYAFLAEVARRVGARVIAVAHNADDQVETVLMHLLRGAGLAGLRGMLYEFVIRNSEFVIDNAITEKGITNDELRIARPLLDVTRSEIESYCKQNGLTPRFDRSNLDTTFFRNRLRHEVLPYLETLNPNLREVLRRTARVLADDYDFLLAQTREAYGQFAREDEGAITFALARWRGLHPALQRGTLRLAVQQLRNELRDVDWTHVEAARRVAMEKGAGAKATLPHGLMLVVGYDDFVVADATREPLLPDWPFLTVERIALPLPSVVELPGSEWVAVVERAASPLKVNDRWTALLDADKIEGELALRCRRAGDRFEPAGLAGHSKSLHEFMIDEKILSAARDRLPILVAGDRILWVCGWRVDERARVTQDTQDVLRVTIRRNWTRTSADERGK